MSEVKVALMTSEQWADVSESVHLWAFKEKRPATMDRIDFVLLNTKENIPLNYCTVRELDAESVYWQYGGASPQSKGTGESFRSYKRNADWCFSKGYKRITTYVENTNLAMLKIALKVGFLIIGTRTFKGSILLELLLEANNE